MNLVAQILGFVALVFYIVGIQQKDKKNLLKIQVFSNVLYGIQYVLLGALSAAFMNGVSISASILFYCDSVKNKTTPKWVLGVLLLIITVIAMLTYDGYYSLIPIVMIALYLYSVWQNNMTIVRIISLIVAIGYIVYNAVVMAYAAIIGSVLALISALIAIIRLDIKRNEKNSD